MNILAIESSCDETAAAVVRDGRTVLSNCVASQIEMHTIYGGVVPEIASRKHVEAVSGLAREVLERAGLSREEVDGVAVTYAPGLIGAVLGGAIVVLLVRRYGIKLVEVFFPKEKIMSLRFMQDSRRLELLVFIVFMIPGTPKDLLCYAVGLTNLRMRDWLWISLVARIPSIITSTIGGNALGERNYVFAAAVFAVTLLISLGGILLYRHICRKENEELARKEEQEDNHNEEND